MSGYLPTGMIPFSAALARSAEALCPGAWANAKPEARALLAVGEVSNREAFGFWTLPGKLGRESYDALRPLLAEGVLPASIRKFEGTPEPIEPASWQARGADRVEDVLKGAAPFTVAGGTTVRGDVLIRGADLDAALSGEPIPAPAAPIAILAAERTASAAKAGRRPNPDIDRFWIELCKLIAHGGVKGGQAGYTERMAQWAIDNMDRPYDAETVRKKISALFREIGWD